MSRIKVVYILIGLAALFYRECSGVGLTVNPQPRQFTVSLGEKVNLLCNANKRPSICLWRTPYKSIYTVGGGRTWENDRLSSNPSAGDNQCGLTIHGVREQDLGSWQCEVGAVVGGEFTTTTAVTTIHVIKQQGGAVKAEKTGLEGEEIILHCDGGGDSCSWRTPYSRSYELLPGEYAERGRIQALAGCSIRVANVQRRDEGEWKCIKGDRELEMVTTTVNIETPLKLSAPTSILQQADAKATLVCHANKQFDKCEWETPYQTVVSFTETDSHENGRLKYFGFSNMDCGIVIQDIEGRDSGGWTCRVTATVAGNLQVSADIVRLFVEPDQVEERPRSIDPPETQYPSDYMVVQYDTAPAAKVDDYDAFDYINGDFDKVDEDGPEDVLDTFPAVPARDAAVSAGPLPIGTTTSRTSPPLRISTTTLPTTRFTTTSTTTPVVSRRVEEQDGFIRDIQRIGKFGTVRIDRVESTEPSRTISTEFPPVSKKEEEKEIQSGLNPSELDFLALISGSRVDNRPFKLDNETSFGTRQSSGDGSRFQFGDVDLKFQEDEDRGTVRSSPSTVGTTTEAVKKSSPDSSLEDRRLQQMRREQEMLARRREEAEAKRKEEKEAKRREEIEARRREEIQAKRKEEAEAKRRTEEKEALDRQQQEEEKRKKELEDNRQAEINAERMKELEIRRKDKIEDENVDTKKSSHDEEDSMEVSKRREEIKSQRRDQTESKERNVSDAKTREEFEARRRSEIDPSRRDGAKRREENMSRRRGDVEGSNSDQKSPKREDENTRRAEDPSRGKENAATSRREEENHARRRPEPEVHQRRGDLPRPPPTEKPRSIDVSRGKVRASLGEEEEPNRPRIRTRVRVKERTEPGSEDSKESVEEEEKRRERIEKLREKQLEETRKLQAEREIKRLEEELQKKREEEKQTDVRRLKEERDRQPQDDGERKRKDEDHRRSEGDRQRQRGKERKEVEDKVSSEEISIQKLLEQKAIEEEEKLRKIEEEKQRKFKEEERRIIKQLEEERRKTIREERERRLKEEKERRRKELEEQRRKELEEKRIKEAKEERERKQKEEIERRREKERERIRNELEEQRRKKLEEEKRQKLEEERARLEFERKRKEEEEERKKIQRENEEKQRKLAEERRREEEEKINKLKLEQDRIRAVAEEQRKKEEEALKLLRQRENERREEISKLKQLQAERDQQLREEREKLRREIELQKKREEEELEKIRIREDQRRKELEELKALQAERDKLLREERERILREKEENRIKAERERTFQEKNTKLLEEERERIRHQFELDRQKEEEEESKKKEEREERHKEIERLKEQQREREIRLKAEREKIEREKEKLARQQEELRRQKELLDRIRLEQEKIGSTTPRSLPKQPPDQQRACLISPWPADGNITCPGSVTARGNFIVKTGNKCQLECNPGFVSLDARETECLDGELTKELICVKPGAMLVVGGRSDTYGVLSSVELITSGGLCRNAVPALPAMRWKSVAASLDTETVVVCGGINFLGDPKTDCWRLEFNDHNTQPKWGKMPALSVPRDAAGWAAEGGKLYVMGGSLGPLSGYTASLEIYDPTTDSWRMGPPLPSERSSHCSVGLGNGSVIVTGGYGALSTVQRLDIDTGRWTDLPELNPLRAQHGCALVEVSGRKGVLVVGGDSGGTRLNDVRFLSLGSPAEWIKISDLNTARWGRPSVGIIGGKITVVGGWDGVKALSTVEYYEEKADRWVTSRTSRLSTERRWAAGAQISNSLFPRCVQKRQ